MQIMNSDDDIQCISDADPLSGQCKGELARFDEPLDLMDGRAGSQIEHGTIDFEHVSFKYKKEAKRNVLNDISIHLKRGRWLELSGEPVPPKHSCLSDTAPL